MVTTTTGGLGGAVAKKPAFDATDPAQQIAKVIASGGQLMDLARTQGLKYAQQRGLLSSSLAGGLAQNEVLKVATPIGLQAAADAATTARQTASIAADTESQGRQLAHDREIAGWNLDAADRQQAAGMLTQFQGTYEQALASINDNKNMKAADRTASIKALNARREKQLGLVRSLFDVDISWGTPAAAAPAKAAVKKPVLKGTKVKKPAASAGVAEGAIRLVNGQRYRFHAGRWSPA
jgi:hypothetical protein